MRVEDYAEDLECLGDDIWVSKRVGAVSYPEDGSEQCFAVEDQSFWFAHRNACILDVFRRYRPAGTIFDIGGGNGVVTLALRAGGYDAVLVEPSLAGARNARSRGLAPVICATLDDAGFMPGVIPAVGLFDVVEHVEGDVQFLSNVRDRLVPGGRVYLTVPALSALWSGADVHAGHFRRYSLGELERTLEAAGFTLEFASYFFAFLVAPVFLCRALPSRLGFGAREEGVCASEHAPSSPAVDSALRRFARRELERLRSARRIRIGTSILTVARSRE